MDDLANETRLEIIRNIRSLPDQQSRLVTSLTIAKTISLNDPSEPNYRLFAEILDMLCEEHAKEQYEKSGNVSGDRSPTERSNF